MKLLSLLETKDIAEETLEREVERLERVIKERELSSLEKQVLEVAIMWVEELRREVEDLYEDVSYENGSY